MLCIDWDPSEGRLIFQKEGEVAVLPVAAPQPQVAALATTPARWSTGESPAPAHRHNFTACFFEVTSYWRGEENPPTFPSWGTGGGRTRKPLVAVLWWGPYFGRYCI